MGDNITIATSVAIRYKNCGYCPQFCDELKALRTSLPPGVNLSDRYPLWGIPFVVKDIVDVAGMETTIGSANWTKFPNCIYPPVPGLPGSPTPDTLEFKDPALLRFNVAPNPETRCHAQMPLR